MNLSNIYRDFKRNRRWRKIQRMSPLKLYAGDIPKRSEYEGVIGLSIVQENDRHIRHDLTQPIPLTDSSVDSFQSEDVFEHIEYENLSKVLTEIYRVLKPGALFRMSVPDYGCDVLLERSVLNEAGEIVFDPGGGGTMENPGHVWFPRIDSVRELVEGSPFGNHGTIRFLHYYEMDGTSVTHPIDYSLGWVMRTPDHDDRVKEPYRPMSLVVDMIKQEVSG